MGNLYHSDKEIVKIEHRELKTPQYGFTEIIVNHHYDGSTSGYLANDPKQRSFNDVRESDLKKQLLQA